MFRLFDWMEDSFSDHAVMVIVPHILVQPVLLRDRHREAGILRLLDRHLTIAVGIDARNIFSRCGIVRGRRCSFCFLLLFLRQTECSIRFVRIAVLEPVDDSVSTDRIGILIRGWNHRRRIRIGNLSLEVRRDTRLADNVLHVRLITMTVQGAILWCDVVSIRDATERNSDDVSVNRYRVESIGEGSNFTVNSIDGDLKVNTILGVDGVNSYTFFGEDGDVLETQADVKLKIIE